MVPEDQLSEVISALYDDAHAQDWSHLSPGDRSRAYSAWIQDERVGGVLTKYMTPEAARAWIKDGPMKEYRRALRGGGRYAKFGSVGGTTAADVVASALGSGWTVIDGTTGDKPFHTRAIGPNGEAAYIAWDEARNFKNVVWAALRMSVEYGISGHIVVTEPQGVTTPKDVVEAHKAIAERCNLSMHYVREQFGSSKK